MQPATPETAHRFLAAELEHQRALERRAGVSTWALIGSLGGVLWLALGVWEDAAPNLTVLSHLIVAMSLPFDVFGGRLMNWLQGAKQSDQVRRFYHLTDFATRRAAFTYWSVRQAVMAAVVMTVGTALPLWLRILLVAWYSLVTLLSGLVVVSSHFDFPFDVAFQSLKQRVTSQVVEVTFFVVAIVVVLGSAPPLTSGIGLAEVRIASLLVLASLMLFGLMWTAQSSAQVDRLVGIRRRLFAGEIDPARAVSEAGRAIGAVDGSTTVQLSLWNLSAALDRAEHLCGSTEATLESLVALLSPDSEQHDNRTNHEMLKIARRLNVQSQEALDRYRRLRGYFDQRIKVVVDVDPSALFTHERSDYFMSEIAGLDDRASDVQARTHSLAARLIPTEEPT